MSKHSKYPTKLEPRILRAFNRIIEKKGHIKIIFSGGTFNPIHYGHLIIAQNAMEQTESDVTLWVPNGPPPHKPHTVDGNLRVKMTKAATKSNPHFYVTSLEAARPVFSYTNDTLRQLREELGPKAEISVILGEDNLAPLATWQGGTDEIFKCRLLIAARKTADQDCGDDEGLLDHWRSKLPQATIERINCPMHSISSTKVRDLNEDGLSIEYYVPPAVNKIIQQEGLYKRAPLPLI